MVDKQRILIVDDDENIAELISLYLMKECYDTKIVGDGESALKEVPVFKPNLILLDLMLPGMDGYQVCREIRTTSQVPIIILSAKGELFDKVLGQGCSPPLSGGPGQYVRCDKTAGRICGVSESHRQPDELFRPLQRPLCGYAAEGAGTFILPCLLSESGLYPRTAVGSYLGL